MTREGYVFWKIQTRHKNCFNEKEGFLWPPVLFAAVLPVVRILFLQRVCLVPVPAYEKARGDKAAVLPWTLDAAGPGGCYCKQQNA